MADTVSNHDLSVVTKGTDHLATTQGSTDVCYNQSRLVPAPYVHFLPSTQLGAGQTTKTMIAGHPIVTRAGVIEAPANSHGGKGGGVSSGTYNEKARPTGASPDVKAEGNLVVRDTDPTTQNSANTTGAFMSPAAQARLEAEKARQKARCTIVKVEGICSGPVDFPPEPGETPEHGRPLGFPPNAKPNGDGYYLEVLCKDTVTLTATRKNAIEAGGPKCPQGVHTTWIVDRSGGGEKPRKETFTGRDVLELGPSWFAINSLDVEFEAKGAKEATGKQKDAIHEQAQIPANKKERKIRERMAAGDPTLSNKKVQMVRNRANKRKEAMTTAQETRNEQQAGRLEMGAKVLNEATKVYKLWSYQNNPLTIQVTELACSGSKNTTLKSFPKGEVKFNLFSDKIAENVAKIKKIADLLQKISSIYGKKGKFVFLSGPKLELAVEYKELLKDGKGVTKSQCNRAWELSISFDKFIYYANDFPLPLLNFFGPMGYAANAFLNAVGIEGQAFIKLALNLSPKVSGKWDEYNVWTLGAFSVEFTVLVEIGCQAKWRDTAEIHAQGYIECTFKLENPQGTKERLIEIEYKGEVQLGVKAGGTADMWGFTKSFDIDYKPPDWKHTWTKGKVGICRPT